MDLFNKFICFSCGDNAALSLRNDTKGRYLVCGRCQTSFPILNSIPRFVGKEGYCESFGLQWNRHKRIQLDSYNGHAFSHERLFKATGWQNDLSGQVILEAGCGAGRFTQILLKAGAQVFSFDYSSAVEANFENNGSSENLVLFQADIYRIPLKRAMFDKVLCLGVLQHTPEPKKAFLSLVPCLRENGEIAIDVYKKTFSSLLHWKYALRPLLKSMDKQQLYRYSRLAVETLGPLSRRLQSVFGPVGRRILPIADYSCLGISPELSRELSVLDTFDMYAPEYDYPQTLKEVRCWFKEAGLAEIEVHYGPNGIVGRAIKPN